MTLTGNETTRNSISGGMEALIQHPQEREKLLDDPKCIPRAVEEIFRWVSPVLHFRRTATRDVTMRGTRISEGDKVVMWYPSANRDEDIFDNPEKFNVRREPNDHLAFGAGHHACVGAPLARCQLRIMPGEILRRFPDIELDGEVRRLRSNFISGIKEMPVRWTCDPK